ncbi:MAG: hypothetical protein IJ583_16115 [Firmicutes bacterium]|nr:hypothetical protein [Bacillota bacterium]
MKKDIKESDLYEPVKKLLEENGFEVQAEVKGCDIAAKKGDELVIVELKKNFNLKLVYQVLDRKTLSENVYAAIPRPKSFKDKNTKNMQKLLEKLKVGLIVVSADSEFKRAEEIFAPGESAARKNSKKRKIVDKEIQERKMSVNTGGVGGTQIMTAYRERAVALACIMERVDNITTNMLKQIYGDNKAAVMARANFYGWFKKIERGVYALSEEGRDYLAKNENNEVVKFYRKEAEKYNV